MEGTETLPRSSAEDEEIELVRRLRADHAVRPEPFNTRGLWVAGEVETSGDYEIESLDGVATRNSDGLMRMEVRLQSDVEAIARPVQMLFNLSMAIDALDQARRELVKECRVRGRSWADIGLALGVSRQTAWEKYSDPED